jgi:hypothetical protein
MDNSSKLARQVFLLKIGFIVLLAVNAFALLFAFRGKSAKGFDGAWALVYGNRRSPSLQEYSFKSIK